MAQVQQEQVGQGKWMEIGPERASELNFSSSESLFLAYYGLFEWNTGDLGGRSSDRRACSRAGANFSSALVVEGTLILEAQGVERPQVPFK